MEEIWRGVPHDQRIGKALTVLNDGLRPFIEQILKKVHSQRWIIVAYEAAELKVSVDWLLFDFLK